MIKYLSITVVACALSFSSAFGYHDSLPEFEPVDMNNPEHKARVESYMETESGKKSPLILSLDISLDPKKFPYSNLYLDFFEKLKTGPSYYFVLLHGMEYGLGQVIFYKSSDSKGGSENRLTLKLHYNIAGLFPSSTVDINSLFENEMQTQVDQDLTLETK